MLMPSRRKVLQGASVGILALAAPPIVRAAPDVWEVSIREFAFDPERLEIAVGDRVRWTNEDIAPHTATALDGSWDTGLLQREETAEVVFGSEGAADYRCTFHPVMTASIIVRA